MSLNDYSTPFVMPKKKLYTAMCISQNMTPGCKSPINHMLEDAQNELKAELKNYEIWVSYIFDYPLCFTPFSKFTADSHLCYKEPSTSKNESHSMSNIMLVGLGLLDSVYREEEALAEYRLNLFTDEKPNRIDFNRIIIEKSLEYSLDPRFAGFEYLLHPRFAELPIRPILWKTKDGDKLLEKYFAQRGIVRNDY